MNVRRIIILAVAAVAAGLAVLLVRSLLGGGTPPVAAAAAPTQVLVAANDVDAGHSLDASTVRWQAWPREAVSPMFITSDVHPDAMNTIAGAIVRTPILAGEPITENKIVRIGGQAGFMSALITPGKRAVSIPISAELGAGGFILPNDHVDVMMTRLVPGNGNNYRVETILRNVRVLAIDQTFKDDKETQSAVGRTATLELAPDEAELVALAQASGKLSLALRGLAESADTALNQDEGWGRRNGAVEVIRYGVARSASPAGRPQ